jgi:hypothetical protein
LEGGAEAAEAVLGAAPEEGKGKNRSFVGIFGGSSFFISDSGVVTEPGDFSETPGSAGLDTGELESDPYGDSTLGREEVGVLAVPGEREEGEGRKGEEGEVPSSSLGLLLGVKREGS